MKSGATESSFYYLSQYYIFPENVDVKRTTHEIIQSNKQYKVIWAHDNCDQAGHRDLPQHIDKIDKIVCVSHWERDQYIKYNRAPAEKLTVIPNGVDDMFRPLGKPKSKTCIFFSAPHKGITPLIPIWKEVIKHHPDAKLKVFSSMSLYGAIQPGEGENETITTDKGLEPSPFIPIYKELQVLPGVEYSPCIDREKLLPHIQDAAFYIHPNVWEETFCVSLAEAMSCGCFPITTDMGALPETSNGMGKYIPMSGQNTPRGWITDDTFHQNFAEEIVRALYFFDIAREEYEVASSAISKFAVEAYNWKKIASIWKSLIQYLTEDNKVSVRPNTSDDIIFQYVYLENEYGVPEKLEENDVILDIGAHCGYFAKLCLDRGSKSVVCFEPEKQNYEYLLKNLSGYDGWKSFNLAVWRENLDEMEFYTYPSSCNSGMNSIYEVKSVDNENTIIQKVRCISLDEVLSKIDKVKILKIDVEGSEYEILMNSKLIDKVEFIVAEYHDLNDKLNYTIQDLERYLIKKNFEVKISSSKFIAMNKGTIKRINSNDFPQEVDIFDGRMKTLDEYYEWASNINMVPAQHIDYLYRLKYKHNFEPKVVYDIGSAVLHWSKFASCVWYDAEFYQIDGFDGYHNLYQKNNLNYVLEVLSDTEKEVIFYESAKDSGSSSYYEMNFQDFPHNTAFKNCPFYRERKVKTKTLDTIVYERNWKLPDLIKMDIQGCELDVLKGAEKTLEYCNHLILELQNKEYMKNAPLNHEVIQYLENKGYALISHFTQNPSDADGDYHFFRSK